ncbi:MAG: hypothetical protein UW68_C0017G0008 [Candidatus Collierbacteria bacterium GW2011_GWB1_44_6]|uniref:Uncharacterized protein n=2 Tax=Candidatus Collieribacteriota TaxID=1752725 RepID=A0A0G1JP01_9BACT|nr:MAG: hypothetical protein UV68_C0002G0024 [Candidatus Collierbacteria bacterium GW2011_GWC2_43_12]KKT73073.1 MAG: hypothetical protein UW68_C0017G0008 [Candidatus Collierbacteria bacterium GW2011_GWB1_44_6]
MVCRRQPQPILTLGTTQGRKKENFTMSEPTYCLVSTTTGKTDHDSTRYGIAPTKAAPEGTVWSYFAQLRLFDNSFPPSVEFHSGTAHGEVMPDNEGWVRIVVKGVEPKDVELVVKGLRERVGCQTLNPCLYLPDNLKTPYERLMHLLHWVLGKY